MTDWPDSFDFETDDVCQNVFKPFIEGELKILRDYDELRPPETNYIFHEHTQRVANNIKKTCLHMGLSAAVANNMYWAVLPHDIGKKNMPVEIWDTEEKPTDNLKKLRRTHTLLGAQIMQEHLHDAEHPFKDLMIDIAAHHHEQMDGQGTHGKGAAELSMPVRLASIVEAYDGWRIWRPHYGERDISPAGVLERMRADKMHMFDKDLFEAFAAMRLQQND